MTLPAQEIVERLRDGICVKAWLHHDNLSPDLPATVALLAEAADFIEAQGATISRLTADNEALRKERDGWKSQCLKAEFDHGELGRLTDKYKARADALAQEVERLREAAFKGSVALESFAEIGQMLSLTGATNSDEIELSGEQLRPALIAAALAKKAIDAALGGSDHG